MRGLLLTLALGLPLAGFACSGGDPGNTTRTVAGFEISDAWARNSRPPHANSAAFLKIENLGDEVLKVVGASTPRAVVTELHTMEVVDEKMKMRRVDAFAIPAGQTQVLEPGSDHLMFFELDGAWEAGQTIPITLEFADGSTQDLQVEVRTL
jgi:copper(I)-binding protein